MEQFPNLMSRLRRLLLNAPEPKPEFQPVYRWHKPVSESYPTQRRQPIYCPPQERTRYRGRDGNGYPSEHRPALRQPNNQGDEEGVSGFRVVAISPEQTPGGWRYEGRQTSQSYADVEGFKVPLLTDEEVHTVTRSLLFDHIEENIESYLGLNEAREATIGPRSLFKKITITREAYHKAVTCANLMGRLYSPTPEIALHLLRHKDAPEGLVTDVAVCQDQQVTTTSCQFTSYNDWLDGHNQENSHMENQYAYAGWCHSHGSTGTFHSDVDDRNVLRTVRTGGLRTTFTLDDFATSIQYLPSMVINEHASDPFGVLGVNYWSYKEEEDRSFLRRVPISIVEESYGVKTNEEELRSQILEHVTVR